MGTLFATFDTAAEMAARGDMGVAQMHALAQLVANPRVKEHLADGEELLVGQANELDFDDYVTLLANWERVAEDPFSRCETADGTPIDPFDMLAAATIGHVRRVVLDSSGVVVNMGRKQRLFKGPLRDAVMMHSKWCICPGCRVPAAQCEADHVLPWANAGPTNSINGGPQCGHPIRSKASGYKTWRDPKGHWHYYRPNGTEIGWRSATTNATQRIFPMPAAS